MTPLQSLAVPWNCSPSFEGSNSEQLRPFKDQTLGSSDPSRTSSEQQIRLGTKGKPSNHRKALGGKSCSVWILELNMVECTAEEQSRVCVLLILLTSERKVLLSLSFVISSIAVHQGVKNGRKTLRVLNLSFSCHPTAPQ